MRLASILLVSALFTCSVISAAVEGKHAHGNRLLRSDDYDEERGYNLAQLMKLDDEASAIKQLATEFAGLKGMNMEALNVFMMMKKKMTVQQATYISNLFAKYMENPRLYH